MKNLGTSIALTLLLSSPMLGACTDATLSQSDQELTLSTLDAGAGRGSDSGVVVGGGELGCADGEYRLTDTSGKVICGVATTPTDAGDQSAYDPGMPAADEYQHCDLVVKNSVASGFGPQLYAMTGCMAANPPLYKSLIELLKFDITVRGVKVGEHSTSTVTRFRWDWDPIAGAYKAPVEDAKTRHSNHWSKDDDRLKRYAMIDTQRTDVTGVGFKAYSSSASTYCACTTDVGHKTEKDSCYGFVSLNPFDTETHVCHGDTRVQVRNFQSAAGKKQTLDDQCGDGLVSPYAPTP